MNAKTTVSQPDNEPLSLDSRRWREVHWEESGLPESIWRRLCRIDAGVDGAHHIAELLSTDHQNRGLAEGLGDEYVPLSAYHVEGLTDAMGKLIEHASEELAELHDFAHKYGVTFEEHCA